MLMFALSPEIDLKDGIPNEDSVSFELDEISVMRPNRMTGLDRVEGGLRGAYGLRWGVNTAHGTITTQIAQGWRAQKDEIWGVGSGFENYLSDYVGRLDINFSDNLSLLNRTRLDQKDFSVRRQENTILVGTQLFHFSASYLYMDDGGGLSDEILSQDSFTKRHSLRGSISGDITRNIGLAIGAEQRLTDNPGIANWWLNAIYSDECFALVGSIYQNYTEDRDIRPGTDFTLNIVFKTLGSTPISTAFKPSSIERLE